MLAKMNERALRDYLGVEIAAAALRKELASAELVAKKHSRWRMR